MGKKSRLENRRSARSLADITPLSPITEVSSFEAMSVNGSHNQTTPASLLPMAEFNEPFSEHSDSVSIVFLSDSSSDEEGGQPEKTNCQKEEELDCSSEKESNLNTILPHTFEMKNVVKLPDDEEYEEMFSDIPIDSPGHGITSPFHQKEADHFFPRFFNVSAPIHSGDAGCSFPTPDEVHASANMSGTSKSHRKAKHNNNQNNSSRRSNSSQSSDDNNPSFFRRFQEIFILTAVLAVIISVVSVIVANSVRDNQQPLSSDDGSGSTPTTTKDARLVTGEDVKNFLWLVRASSKYELDSIGTPQHQAAMWLAETDELELTIPRSTSKTDPDVYRYMSRYVLATLYFALGGPSWNQPLFFLSEKDHCLWNNPFYIADSKDKATSGCHCQNGKVIALYLESNNLDGELPTEIGLLTTLQELDLGQNNVRGSLGTTICDLTKLTFLDLGENKLNGLFPRCLSNMTDLRSLHLSSNELDGELPDMPRLSNLVTFLVDRNELDGDVSTLFNHMKQLQVLYLGSNTFEGWIDEKFLSNSTNLEAIDLSSNNFIGNLINLQRFPNLQVLDLHGNRLTGELPQEFSVNKNLRFLSLRDNGFSGTIPPNIAQLVNLNHLDLSANWFSGAMPSEISQLTDLEHLSIGGNFFDPGTIPTEYSKLENLRAFSLPTTNRIGVIPEYVATFSLLEFLVLESNHFVGTIPWEFGVLYKLQYLVLNKNLIGGGIPSSFSNLRNLKTILLDRTNITSGFGEVCGLPNLVNSQRNGGKSGAVNLVTADCGGDVPRVADCSCCGICCVAGDPYCRHQFDDEAKNLEAIWSALFGQLPYDVDSQINLRGQSIKVATLTNP